MTWPKQTYIYIHTRLLHSIQLIFIFYNSYKSTSRIFWMVYYFFVLFCFLHLRSTLLYLPFLSISTFSLCYGLEAVHAWTHTHKHTPTRTHTSSEGHATIFTRSRTKQQLFTFPGITINKAHKYWPPRLLRNKKKLLKINDSSYSKFSKAKEHINNSVLKYYINQPRWRYKTNQTEERQQQQKKSLKCVQQPLLWISC